MVNPKLLCDGYYLYFSLLDISVMSLISPTKCCVVELSYLLFYIFLIGTRERAYYTGILSVQTDRSALCCVLHEISSDNPNTVAEPGEGTVRGPQC